jgi:DNA-binding Lrp family transcriptional regulator
MKAYVMLRAQLMETADVVDMIRKIKGVVQADVTFGPYDAVVQVEAADLDTLSRVVIRDIRTVPGVIDTLTCLAVNPTR